jgi:hypothetical protein
MHYKFFCFKYSYFYNEIRTNLLTLEKLFIMKKYKVITLVSFLILFIISSSVFVNQSFAQSAYKKKELSAALISKLDSLASCFKKLDSYPLFVNNENGQFVLSEKEKKVKPTYLYDPSYVNSLTTLDQKYRGLAVFLCDANIASMYDMPTQEYKRAIGKLAAAINLNNIPDPFDINSFNNNLDYSQATLFWTYCAAFCIESTFILTQNIDTFITCFNDRHAAEVSQRLNIVEDAIFALIPHYPAMRSLHEILEPLYIINARDVAQLTTQLYQLKGQIEIMRGRMLE